MTDEQQNLTEELYNIILNPHTREWERTQLVKTKNALDKGINANKQFEKLEVELRPLAIRDNLTPDVTDFYMKITGNSAGAADFDLSRHFSEDAKYEERAVFAGGCFWCMVEPFEERSGILSVVSGYTGGHIASPSYDQVSGGYSGHVEAVEIIFDSRLVQYEELIELYWQITDPTDALGQFQDRGEQYRPVIFVQNEQQKQIAEKSKQALTDSGKYKKPIVTEIRMAETFWPAENYHQQFYRKQRKKYEGIKRTRQQLQAFQYLRSRLRLKRK